MGSAMVAGWIAQAAFWTLLIIGAWSEDLGPKTLGLLVVLWLAGMFGLPHVSFGAGLSTPFVAVLDIALVFLVFKGDIRLT
jgi:hypothetical protein